MDDDLIGCLFGGLLLVGAVALAGYLAIYAAWILIALLVRIFSVVVTVWSVTFLSALVMGGIASVVLPIRVFMGKGISELRQITPSFLVDGIAIKEKPQSPNAGYGWDSAWPNYMPYQAKEDLEGVLREVVYHVGSVLDWFNFWSALIFPFFFGYALGIWIFTLLWLIVMILFGLFVTGLQEIARGLYKLFDIGNRRRSRASMKCPYCYGETHLPGYRCSNPECSVIHWTLLPGPLGIFTRWCSCGVRLPNTVSAAAAKRLAPVCPYCRKDLPDGSGVRQTVQIALIGSIGAGKSRLLDAMITELKRVLYDLGGSICPLNTDAEEYLNQAMTRRQQAAPTAKTHDRHPTGLPFLIKKDKLQVELQVMDAAGEAFANWDETANLRYLDTANGIVLVLDPLALPEIHDHLNRSQYANSIKLAEGDQENAYGNAIDRLKSESIPLKKRGLAVVLTKGDVLTNLPVASSVDLADSALIKQWLINNGSDLMVQRFEMDFREVQYFVVDSMWKRDIHTSLNPWWVIDWLLNESKSPLRLGQCVMTPLTPETPSPPELSKGNVA